MYAVRNCEERRARTNKITNKRILPLLFPRNSLLLISEFWELLWERERFMEQRTSFKIWVNRKLHNLCVRPSWMLDGQGVQQVTASSIVPRSTITSREVTSCALGWTFLKNSPKKNEMIIQLPFVQLLISRHVAW